MKFKNKKEKKQKNCKYIALGHFVLVLNFSVPTWVGKFPDLHRVDVDVQPASIKFRILGGMSGDGAKARGLALEPEGVVQAEPF